MLHFTSLHFPSNHSRCAAFVPNPYVAMWKTMPLSLSWRNGSGDFGRGVREATPCEGDRLGNLESTGHWKRTIGWSTHQKKHDFWVSTCEISQGVVPCQGNFLGLCLVMSKVTDHHISCSHIFSTWGILGVCSHQPVVVAFCGKP